MMPERYGDGGSRHDGGQAARSNMATASANALDGRKDPHPAGRDSRRRAPSLPRRRPLTPAHAIVLGASARALTEHGRSVALPEIVGALTAGEQRALLAKYPTQRLSNAVLKILAQLLITERLVEVGRVGAYR